MRLSPPTISQLQKLFLRLDGLNAMHGPLRSEVLTGDAIRIGSPTLLGRPIRAYGDNAGGQTLLFLPDMAELYIANKSTDPLNWDKALVYLCAQESQSMLFAQGQNTKNSFGFYASDQEAHFSVSCLVPGTTFGLEGSVFPPHESRIAGTDGTRTWRVGTDPNDYLCGCIMEGLNLYLRSGYVSSLPTPSAYYRGNMIRVEGGAGVVDKLYCCMKKADNSYAWIEVASG